MKRCPYCAEKIKDDAIKCKHCGEWLNEKKSVQVEVQNEDVPVQVAQQKEQLPSHDASSPAENIAMENAEEEIQQNARSPEKESGDWDETVIHTYEDSIPAVNIKNIPRGWGWFVLLSFYVAGVRGISFSPVSNIGITLEYSAVIITAISMMLIYFRIRRKKLISKPYFKTWDASLISGVIAYIVSCIVYGALITGAGYLDGKIAWKEYGQRLSVLQNENMKFVKEEESIWEKFIFEPTSEEQKIHSAESLKRLLGILRDREKLTNESFDLYLKYPRIKRERLFSLKEESAKIRDTYKNGLILIQYGVDTKSKQHIEGGVAMISDAGTRTEELQKKYSDIMTK